jgi:hypothetical protein
MTLKKVKSLSLVTILIPKSDPPGIWDWIQFCTITIFALHPVFFHQSFQIITSFRSIFKDWSTVRAGSVGNKSD